MTQINLQGAVKIPTLNVKYLMTRTRHSERWSQRELDNLIRDLGLPEDGAEHLYLALKEKGNLSKGTKSSVYRNREQTFRKNFHFYQELSLVYGTNVNGFINKLKPGVYKD